MLKGNERYNVAHGGMGVVFNFNADNPIRFDGQTNFLNNMGSHVGETRCDVEMLQTGIVTRNVFVPASLPCSP